ncbi:hypothetical protein SAY87_027147 [Trapa incisa]|uniref:Response regulatory domain-containing protein n=1 Tax=Trapa incisa TaxID=236973 RepID=A0AAN7GSW9_9MYRT|nr:hypothetical protein SAY87_027147 [Trapa incisa]
MVGMNAHIMNPIASNMRSTANNIRILLVDDDSVALCHLMEVLKKWNHQGNLLAVLYDLGHHHLNMTCIGKFSVTGVTNPTEAMSILRKSQGGFDLVITDYHMPVMNGIDLQKCINEEFGLPVIMMSEEENEYVRTRSLECGAALFIQKPVQVMDFENIWMHTVPGWTGVDVAPPPAPPCDLPAAAVAVPTYNNNNARKTKVQQKTKRNGRQTSSVQKKKVAWDKDDLHNRFLHAVNFLGIDTMEKEEQSMMRASCNNFLLWEDPGIFYNTTSNTTTTSTNPPGHEPPSSLGGTTGTDETLHHHHHFSPPSSFQMDLLNDATADLISEHFGGNDHIIAPDMQELPSVQPIQASPSQLFTPSPWDNNSCICDGRSIDNYSCTQECTSFIGNAYPARLMDPMANNQKDQQENVQPNHISYAPDLTDGDGDPSNIWDPLLLNMGEEEEEEMITTSVGPSGVLSSPTYFLSPWGEEEMLLTSAFTNVAGENDLWDYEELTGSSGMSSIDKETPCDFESNYMY